MTVYEKAPRFALKAPGPDSPSLSVVIPFFNEQGNAGRLLRELVEAVGDLPTEIIAVDDGSRDATASEILAAKPDTPGLRLLRHETNAGQSRAVRTGVLASRAAIVATIDGDCQNLPSDVMRLYSRLTRNDAPELLAMICGVRQVRQDSGSKMAASRIANAIRQRLLHDESDDTGCGLKVFRREAFLRLPYFDHFHRYLPALMRREGFVVEHEPVAHRPRTVGRSNYTNWGRAAVALRDVLGVMWLNARSKEPGGITEV